MPRVPARTYRELPISVQHCWDGYPIVDAALQRLEQGQFYDAALLADAVYTDDRVSGVLQTRVNALFGLPLEFKYPGQEEAKATAKPVGEDAPTMDVGESEDPPEVLALKQKIAELARRNWEKIFPGAAAREQMRWGLLLNAGLGELVWDWGRDGLLWPTLKTWSTQFLYWRWDTRSYHLITQQGPVEVRAGDGKWVLFSPTGHNHGWLYGLIRSLAKLWLDRVFLARDWARATEKYSLGIIKMKVPSNASEPDKKRFEQSMTNLPNESAVLLPQGKGEDASFDIEMMATDAAVNWQSFKERKLSLDTDIAVCVLGQNLTTDVQQGSRAAAQVHDNVRGDFLQADDECWATMARTQVLTPWVEYNWGDIIAEMGMAVEDFVPLVKHLVEPAEDMAKRADAQAKAAQALPALAGTEVDVRAYLEQNGFPVVDGKGSSGQAPPGADVNERPPNPRGPQGDATPSEVADLSLVSARRPPSKPGQRKGRVVVDELLDAAKVAGARSMDRRRAELQRIVDTSASYAEMRQRIKRLYFEAKPSELRPIMEKALMASRLIGHASASVDHRH